MRRFALISLCLHAALIALLVGWFQRSPRPAEAPDTQGAVELVMLEQQGHGATALPPPVPTPEAVAPPAVPPPPPTPEAAAKPEEPPPPPPPPPPREAAAEAELPPPPPPVPPPQEAAKPEAPPPLQPVPPRAPTSAPRQQQTLQVPQINLGGTDSETNAIASGDHVVPASVDAKFHNKEPVYPLDAARRAEQGAVILVIHVSPYGLAEGVDVVESSGFVSLDRAARDAVLGWHFLPAVKDGQPVPFDMPLRVKFHLD